MHWLLAWLLVQRLLPHVALDVLMHLKLYLDEAQVQDVVLVPV
jgi:hypothetical protein